LLERDWERRHHRGRTTYVHAADYGGEPF
jgi:hypothetical protein